MRNSLAHAHAHIQDIRYGPFPPVRLRKGGGGGGARSGDMTNAGKCRRECIASSVYHLDVDRIPLAHALHLYFPPEEVRQEAIPDIICRAMITHC